MIHIVVICLRPLFPSHENLAKQKLQTDRPPSLCRSYRDNCAAAEMKEIEASARRYQFPLIEIYT